MNHIKFFILVLTVLFAVNTAVFAESIVHNEELYLNTNSSKYVNLGKKIVRIFVGSSIITVKQLSNSMEEFVITSTNEGLTNILVWTADGERYEYDVIISKKEFEYHESVKSEEIVERLSQIKGAQIEKAIDLPNVHVRQIGSRILLSGTVENTYEHDYALETAKLFINNDPNSVASSDEKNIMDVLQVLHPTQIRLEAQVIEINSDKTKDLGITYGESGSGGIFFFGQSYGATTPFRHNPAKWFEESFSAINATIHTLVTNGDARILSRPSITTLSGKSAKIQIGGQIPYSVSNSNGTTIEFKDYGIILQFNPTTDIRNRINAAIHTEVSSIGNQSVDGQPIISTRTADSVVTVDSGSSMIIGGLMDSSESKAVSKIPLLGNIPILGEFFKYTSKRRDKRELIIVITPYILEENEHSYANMTNEMRDYYHAGQREQNTLNDVDLNALPPPFEDNKSKKDKKKKKADKPQKDAEKIRKNKEAEEMTPKETEKDENKNSNANVEVFGDAF